jgi:hypothetical protein
MMLEILMGLLVILLMAVVSWVFHHTVFKYDKMMNIFITLLMLVILLVVSYIIGDVILSIWRG